MKNARCRALGGMPAIILIAMLASACGADEPATVAPLDGDYHAERTTEGTVTTVRHISGAKWKEAARFEEELSIGVLEGGDEYMFGQLLGVWMTDDLILVVDTQAPAVRAYDHDGRYVRTYGGRGQGPGEYERPVGVATLSDGRVLVQELAQGISVFSLEGDVLDTWTWTSGGPSFSLRGDSLLVTDDDRVFVPATEIPEDVSRLNFSSLRQGRQEVSADGAVGDIIFTDNPDYEVPTIELTMLGFTQHVPGVPFAPSPQVFMRRDGSWIVGVGDEYRFEIRRPDATTTVVEMPWEPVSVLPEEADMSRHMVEQAFRRTIQDDEWTFDGAIPGTKPAFDSIYSDRAGRIYVSRAGRATRVEGECDEEGPSLDDPTEYTPCFAGAPTTDVFHDDGSYLGKIEIAGSLAFRSYRGIDTWLGMDVDADGTVMVKKYRLVLPDATSD